ncbi:MAG: hypothetical protein QNJ63_01715 [Calothrix sp. MO_192.B10]|nr:hypothetical protein [Calothrix sp. MO_192.B10]
MSNNNQLDNNNKQWQEIHKKWWQITLALLSLVILGLLYPLIPANNDLVKNLIVGALITALVFFLISTFYKVVISSLRLVMSEMRKSLIMDMTIQLEEIVIKTREERAKERKELIQTVTGGKTVQGLISKMKQLEHEDLELYRFLGLRGEEEDREAFHNTTFQNFNLIGRNQNAIYFFWANTSTNPASEITARVDRKENFLTVSFKSYSVGGANIAIRASGDTARFRDNRMRYLSFDMRLRKEVENDSDNVEVGFRLVDGWLQHWHYSYTDNEGYIKVLLKHYCQLTSNETVSAWETFSLDIENREFWHLFLSDGNYKYGSKSPDFEIISSVIFEVGCREEEMEGALEPKPGPGQGKVDINNIRLSEKPMGKCIG